MYLHSRRFGLGFWRGDCVVGGRPVGSRLVVGVYVRVDVRFGEYCDGWWVRDAWRGLVYCSVEPGY